MGTGFPGLKQYEDRIYVSCSRTQRSDAGEARIRNLSVSSQVVILKVCGLLWRDMKWQLPVYESSL